MAAREGTGGFGMERTVTIWVTDQEGNRLKRQQPAEMRYVNTDVLEGPDQAGI